MKYLLFIALSFLSVFSLIAQHSYNHYQKDAVTYREHPLDIIKMKLEVSFEPEAGMVKGKVTHSFVVLQKRVDSVFFDGPGINILKASLNGESLKFSQNAQGIWVYPSGGMEWDQKGEIVFDYTAKPKKGIYFIGWNAPEPITPDPFAVRKQIWTQGQGIDNRHWIPMYDDMNDKFITETVVTFSKNYQVLSNGKLLSKKANKDNTITWHYAMSKPHAGYLLMLGIGKYAVATAKSKSGVPLQFWYYPEFPERVEPTFRYSAQMIDFLEEQTGVKYPWESYSQIMVQDFLYGAMENTTATIFGDFFHVDTRAYLDRNYIGVNCHELTHQWFGDFITARDGRDAWLQESFATFYPKQLSRVLDGDDEWSWQRRAHQNSAVEAGKKDSYAVRNSAGGTARVYPKGAAVISMLAYILGEDQWKRVLNHYLKTHAYSNVETNDLQQAIKDVLGLNLDWFFDEWILRGGEPHFRVHYEDLKYTDGIRATEIAIEQIQKMDEIVRAFKMPIQLEVHYEDGSKDVLKEMIDEDFEVVKIPNRGNKKISYVLFDPNSNVLKQLTFKKSFQELQEQLERATYMLDRYDALVGMRNIPIEEKREVLYKAMEREKHEAMIIELISQLGKDNASSSVKILKGLMSFPKASVRDHLLKTLTPNATYQDLYFVSLNDSSYDVVKTALEMLSVQFQGTNEMPAILKRVEGVNGMNHNIEVKMLELSILNELNVQAAKDRLKELASYKFEFRTRIQAFQALKSTNVCDQQVIDYLFQAMLCSNSRLASPAADLANYFGSQMTQKYAMKKFFEAKGYSDAEKEVLLKYLPILK